MLRQQQHLDKIMKSEYAKFYDRIYLKILPISLGAVIVAILPITSISVSRPPLYRGTYYIPSMSCPFRYIERQLDRLLSLHFGYLIYLYALGHHGNLLPARLFSSTRQMSAKPIFQMFAEYAEA